MDWRRWRGRRMLLMAAVPLCIVVPCSPSESLGKGGLNHNIAFARRTTDVEMTGVVPSPSRRGVCTFRDAAATPAAPKARTGGVQLQDKEHAADPNRQGALAAAEAPTKKVQKAKKARKQSKAAAKPSAGKNQLEFVVLGGKSTNNHTESTTLGGKEIMLRRKRAAKNHTELTILGGNEAMLRRKRAAKGGGGSECCFVGCKSPVGQPGPAEVELIEGAAKATRGKGRPANAACDKHTDWYERASRKGQACQFDRCTKMASYGDLISRVPTSCAAHRQPHEQHLHATVCRIADCSRFATYGPPSSRGGGGKALACRLHKLASHVDVRNKLCQSDNCAHQATFGARGEGKAKRCSAHREEGDADLRNAALQCKYAHGCTKRASYGPLTSLLPLFCSEHRDDSQVNIRNGRCMSSGCSNYAAYFNRAELQYGRVSRMCDVHSQGHTHVSIIRAESASAHAPTGSDLRSRVPPLAQMPRRQTLFQPGPTGGQPLPAVWKLQEPEGVGPEGRFNLFFQMQKIKKMAQEASASLDDIMSGRVTIKELERLGEEEDNDEEGELTNNPWEWPLSRSAAVSLDGLPSEGAPSEVSQIKQFDAGQPRGDDAASEGDARLASLFTRLGGCLSGHQENDDVISVERASSA